ncbi:MAG: sigma-70 family RNA polymerase sigma factor [Candidatus Peregrinibacteria bacterium]|nr:sigma-70 family RNA polymerase sigma factor [Candidatus Peregrinibacteria bacterium]
MKRSRSAAAQDEERNGSTDLSLYTKHQRDQLTREQEKTLVRTLREGEASMASLAMLVGARRGFAGVLRRNRERFAAVLKKVRIPEAAIELLLRDIVSTVARCIGTYKDAYKERSISSEVIEEHREHHLSSILHITREALKLFEKEIARRGVQNLVAKINSGEQARNHIIEANIPLAVDRAKKYGGVEFGDRVQLAVTGTMRATATVDAEQWAFSTHAYQWIRNAVLAGVRNQQSTVRVPTHMQSYIANWGKIEGEFRSAHRRSPSLEEMAEEFGITPEEASCIARARSLGIQHRIEQGAGIAESPTTMNEEMIADTRGLSALELAGDLEHLEIFRECFDELRQEDKRLWKILKWRFYEKFTLRGIGSLLGITKERVRQLDGKAIESLRSRIEKKADMRMKAGAV